MPRIRIQSQLKLAARELRRRISQGMRASSRATAHTKASQRRLARIEWLRRTLS